ncbi:MAG: hypothetical protein Q7S64_03310 [bacterium]|nr:hypothetical protein [bacterium]
MAGNGSAGVGDGCLLITWVQLGAGLAQVPINMPDKPGNINIAHHPSVSGAVVFTGDNGRVLTVMIGQLGHSWNVHEHHPTKGDATYLMSASEALSTVTKMVLNQQS